jgi:uncharacterized membrane protein
MPAGSESAAELPTSRLLALADGIFAIAMTLLVFEVKVPVVDLAREGALRHGLWLLWPHFASVVLSILTLGFSWIGHHNQYVAIRRTDRPFLWINIAFLAAIAFVPFSSGLLGAYPLQQVAVVVYAANLAIAGALLYAHWSYATRGKRLVDPSTPDALIRQTQKRVLLAPVAYLAVIAASFLWVPAALVGCLAIPLYFMMPGKVDRHWSETPR